MTNSNEDITALEAAEILGVTRSALCNRRRAGLPPAWTDIASPGARSSKVRYRLSDVLALRDERKSEQRPTIAELTARMAVTEEELTESLAVVEGRLLTIERHILTVTHRAGLSMADIRALSPAEREQVEQAFTLLQNAREGGEPKAIENNPGQVIEDAEFEEVDTEDTMAALDRIEREDDE